jgi:hypothetical protein
MSAAVGEEAPAAIVRNFQLQPQMVMDADGAHIKDMFTSFSISQHAIRRSVTF